MINFEDFVHIRSQKEKVINVNMSKFRTLSNKIGKKPSLWTSCLHFTSHNLEGFLLLPLIAAKVNTYFSILSILIPKTKTHIGILMNRVNSTSITKWQTEWIDGSRCFNVITSSGQHVKYKIECLVIANQIQFPKSKYKIKSINSRKKKYINTIAVHLWLVFPIF